MFCLKFIVWKINYILHIYLGVGWAAELLQKTHIFFEKKKTQTRPRNYSYTMEKCVNTVYLILGFFFLIASLPPPLPSSKRKQMKVPPTMSVCPTMTVQPEQRKSNIVMPMVTVVKPTTYNTLSPPTRNNRISSRLYTLPSPSVPPSLSVSPHRSLLGT